MFKKCSICQICFDSEAIYYSRYLWCNQFTTSRHVQACNEFVWVQKRQHLFETGLWAGEGCVSNLGKLFESPF